MNILFTICGRAGSKGVKNKNTRDFLGYPLVLYTLSAIQLYLEKHPEKSCIIGVNTDSESLVKIINDRKQKDIYYIPRKDIFKGDRASKIQVIGDTLKEIEKINHVKYDMVVDLDITSPIRTIADIENLIDKKIESKADVVFSVTESRRNPYFNMVIKDEQGYYKRVLDSSFNARQEAPEVYDMNATMYAYTPDFLKSGKDIFDGVCDIIIMKDTGILDIDNENDFTLLEVIATYLYKNEPELRKVRENIEC